MEFFDVEFFEKQVWRIPQLSPLMGGALQSPVAEANGSG
jgi:hypothetical protein